MVQVPGTIVSTSYHGATTQYLVSVGPGITLTVLEQNLPRMRADDRWTPATGCRSAGCPSTPSCCDEPPRRRRRRRRAGRSERRPRPGARRASVTVLEARDRVGGRVEQVRCPTGASSSSAARWSAPRHTATSAGRGARAHPGAVVRRGAGRDHPPGARSVDVGDWPSWSTDADRASYETGRGRARQGRARIDPTTRALPRPATGSTSSASATGCARSARPRRAAAQGARPA
jgi:hypothetical protein